MSETPSRRIRPTLLGDTFSYHTSFCRLLGFDHQENLIPGRLLYAIEALCLGADRYNMFKTVGDHQTASDEFGSHWTYRKSNRNPPLSVLDFDDGTRVEFLLHLHYTVRPKEGIFTCSVNKQGQDPLDLASKKTVNVLKVTMRLKEKA